MNTLRYVLDKRFASPKVIYGHFQTQSRSHVTQERKPKTAVLMVYTGGPKCIEEVNCFVKRVFIDRNLAYGRIDKARRLEEASRAIPIIREKYQAIGNRTPQFDWINMQAKLVQERLDLMCLDTAPHKTFIGCQFVKPSISDALKQITEYSDLQNVVILPMYPQYSCGLTGGCYNTIYKFYKSHPLPEGVKWYFVDSWATTYSLIRNTAFFIKKELMSHKIKSETCTVIFGARPMPPQAMQFGDFYTYLVGATALHVVKQLDTNMPYAIAWHDAPGGYKWSQPTVSTVIKDYVAKGKKWFILAPISTVIENMVTAYDYDIHLKEHVLPELGSGIKLLRLAAPNNSGYFINAVVEVCKDTLTRPCKIPFHVIERCILCDNAACAKYKQWYKNLFKKGKTFKN